MEIASSRKKNGKVGNMGVVPLGTTLVFTLSYFRLSLARLAKSDPPRHQPCGPRWCRPPPPLSPATAIVAVRCCWPLLLPPPTTGATGHWCHRSLPPAAPSAAGLSLRHPLLSPPADAAAAVVGRYCCRLRPLPQKINRFNICEKQND